MLIAQRASPGAALIKLGYKASAEQFAPGALLDFACLAEAVGFDSVFISDHFQPWKHTDGHAPFSLAWLGALGARTSRIVMGTSVLTPTFRYHPSIVAQAFGTLGSLFPGRMILGVGTGESLNEVPATGNPWPEFKERFARLREAIALIRRCGPRNASASKENTTAPRMRPSMTGRRFWCRSMLPPPALSSPNTPGVSQTASSARAASRWSFIRRRCCPVWRLDWHRRTGRIRPSIASSR